MHLHGTPGTRSSAATLLLAASSVVGCSEPVRAPDAVTVDTVAGIIHVRNARVTTGHAWLLGPPAAIGGGLEADESYSFGRVSGVTVLDGRTYVADSQSRDIRVFDRQGRFLFRFGRAGEGPGDGFRVGRDGWFYDRLSLTRGINSYDSLAVIAYDDTGQVRDTVLVAETPRKYVSVVVDQVPLGGLPVPFAPWATTAVGPDGRIARSFGARFEFDLMSPAGSVQRTVELETGLVAVSAIERDSVLQAMRRQAGEMSDGLGRMEDFAFPDFKAAVTHLLADADGCWWVGANQSASRSASPARFEIFDPAGIRLATLAVPFRVLEIGHDYIAGVATDEMGVETVVVAALDRGASPNGP